MEHDMAQRMCEFDSARNSDRAPWLPAKSSARPVQTGHDSGVDSIFARGVGNRCSLLLRWSLPHVKRTVASRRTYFRSRIAVLPIQRVLRCVVF